MKNWRFVFYFILSINPLFSSEPVRVVIEKSDIDVLGGWPLNRRWYAVAVQNLLNNGADSVFLDIAFPAANYLQPESDALFSEILQTQSNIFLLAHTDSFSAGDSLSVLGAYNLTGSRFFVPFSSAAEVLEERIYIRSHASNSLIRLFAMEKFPKNDVSINFPSKPLPAEFNFIQAVKGEIPCENRTVLIYLNFPGVTSYILNPRTQQPFSTTELQLWAASQIRSEKYFRSFSLLILFSIYLCALLPLIFLFTYKHSFIPGGLSFLLLLSVSLNFHFTNYYVPCYFNLFLLIPFVLSGYAGIRKKRKQPQVKSIVIQTTPKSDENERTSSQIKALQDKLDFYEYLMNQIRPLENKKLPPYLLIHPKSPLLMTLHKAEQIARTDIPVMIHGESGTGKEQFAKFIHEKSRRSSKNFVAVNCASLNENLIESELFGYESGAFTGATKRKIGRFEIANGGTLFLDEISETSLSFQVKLLRVLQEGIFERVGGVSSIRVSVRIIAATNQNLAAAIRNSTFREDLYYRLNGYSLHISPLRARKMDIEYLFKAFLFQENPNLKISGSIVTWLQNQPWPGNVRELKAATKRAVINCGIKNRNFMLPNDFGLENAAHPKFKDDTDISTKILEVLREDGFRHRSISNVARKLELHRVTVTEYFRGWIIRYLRDHQLVPEKVSQEIIGNSRPESLEKVQQRINKYCDAIRENIRKGLDEKMSDTLIRQLYFKNLPKEFENDLFDLIHHFKSIN